MIDPTDDPYGEAEFKDDRDFFGSNDATLEMGVAAVAVCIVCWLFFKSLFVWAIGISLAILAVRMLQGRTTLKGLWARISGLVSGARERIARTKVKLIVEMIPDKVSDAEAVYAWMFPTPYRVDSQEYYRRWLVALLFERITKKSTDEKGQRTLQMADALAMLADYGDEPLYRLLQSTIRRKMAPSTKPVEAKQQALISPLPIPGLNMLTQALAVALVLVGLWGVWGWKSSEHNDKRADRAEDAYAAWEQAAIQANERAQAADVLRAQETATARQEAEKSRALATTVQGRLSRFAAREKKRNEEALSGAPVDLDGRLRELADPAAVAEPPAAAADSGGPAG